MAKSYRGRLSPSKRLPRELADALDTWLGNYELVQSLPDQLVSDLLQAEECLRKQARTVGLAGVACLKLNEHRGFNAMPRKEYDSKSANAALEALNTPGTIYTLWHTSGLTWENVPSESLGKHAGLITVWYANQQRYIAVRRRKAEWRITRARW